MKKISILFLLVLVFISCDKENLEPVDRVSSINLKNDVFSFSDWGDFFKTYNKFLNLNFEELAEQSFFTPNTNRNLDISPAMQGILNEKNEFELGGKIIWYNDGGFYEKTLDSKDKLNLKEIGSIENKITKKRRSNNTKVIMGLNGSNHSNQHRFWKQRYVEDCGRGKVQGRSPREFKFVNELHSEHIYISGPIFPVHYYALYLRVKLEYNQRRRSWRHSGERREIMINVIDYSRLTDRSGRYLSDLSGNPMPYQIYRNLSCASDQIILLRSYNNPNAELRGYYWDARMTGTISQKMFGDVESNRWINNISW